MPILELDGISKKFGALTVAEQISFAVEKGEALGIIEAKRRAANRHCST